MRKGELTVNIGIDKIGFYVPHYYVHMHDLADARGVEREKFTIGIGQDEMAVAPITQDPVTLAANAAMDILTEEDKEAIDLVMFCTETGIDHSKAAGIFVHELLGLPKHVRTIELKQACYSATAALQLAMSHVAMHEDKKVLILASDIARYGIATPGEVTQGAGAVAFLVSKEPKIMTLDRDSAYVTKDIMDFWRPTYSDVAFVDGKYSNEQYIAFFNDVWQAYKEKTARKLEDFEAVCFHIPYTKMGLKALQTVLDEADEAAQERLVDQYNKSVVYSRRIGNIYSASLYLGFVSLLENGSLKAGDRIGMFSYGSGAVGEFYSGTLVDGFEKQLRKDTHENLFEQRTQLSVEQYENVFEQSLPTDGSTVTFDVNEDPAPICLQGVTEHKRQYVNKKVVATVVK